jgi:two-component system response regulator (stage 0 sporulation protein A)
LNGTDATHIYEHVANKRNVTNASVERDIRTAIEIGYSRASLDYIIAMFGYSIDIRRGKPTNSEFIFTVADYLINNKEIYGKERI